MSQRPVQHPDAHDPLTHHTRLQNQWLADVRVYDGREKALSTARLVLFVGGAVALGNGLYTNAWAWTLGGALALLGFALAVFAHGWVLRRRESAQTRADVHGRHLQRLDGSWRKFHENLEDPYPLGHPYAQDIDVGGAGSLLQRFAVSHTQRGFNTLTEYLGGAADLELIKERQQAVRELVELADFRYEFEAVALEAARDQSRQAGTNHPASRRKQVLLDGESFEQFAKLPSLFASRPWLAPTIFALPLVTLALFALGHLELLPSKLWLISLTTQVVLAMSAQGPIHRAFNLGSARQSVVEAFEQMLALAERQQFKAPLLARLSERLRVGEQRPSDHMAALRKWVSLGELRQQFLLWAAVNPMCLWDLHILRGIENWNRRAGLHTQDWFVALGELEALSSLASAHALEPDSTFPEIVPAEVPLQFEQLEHPLLSKTSRIPNDLSLQGLGTALVVTGSNMAGKSTLLRSVGLNVALGLAGGPVLARKARIPRLRLRASMRAQDNLQEGASYFRAELDKLRGVVEGADQSPPVLFLLDELLRGTNERARHVGAKAVLMHLLDRHGCGLVATHDVALAALEEKQPSRIQNVHFTDTMRDGEMLFDYQLRPGIVKTSNALRLLAMAGIDVPREDVPEGGAFANVEGGE